MKRVNLLLSEHMPPEIEGAYQTLRTNILFGGTGRKVFLFASAAPGEGKSTAVLRLAMSMARLGKKVLVLDADLRGSKLHTRIDMQGRMLSGLSNFLREELIVEEAVCSTNIERLYLFPPGPKPDNPTELLSSERFRELMEILRKVFDVILVDTPALGTAVDAHITAVRADAAVIVIEAGTARARDEKGAVQMLQRSRCPVIGAVLMKAKGEEPLA